jgi:hypothetical protein
LAARKTTFEQRQELHALYHWLTLPVEKPIDFMTKIAVRHFLDGEDAMAHLLDRGIEPFVAKRACEKARTVLQNERMKRRLRALEILRNRERYKPTFTSENFRITMDHTQNRNSSMVNVSIHCIVEIWTAEDVAEKEYLINFSDFKTKDWLTRLMVWALMNQREILIKPATDVEMNSMKVFIPKDKN